MKYFHMKGHRISTPREYRQYFSPEDILRQKEVAGGFAVQNLSCFSSLDQYFSVVMFSAAFPETFQDILAAVTDPVKQYWKVPVNQTDPSLEWAGEHQPYREFLKELWEQIGKTSDALGETEKICCFFLLASAYFLAQMTLKECPLTPQQIEDGFLKKVPEKTIEEWITFVEDESEIKLRARQEPYKILMKQGIDELRKTQYTIVPRKITAEKNIQGTTEWVTLWLCRSPEDPEPQEIRLKTGEYRYCSFVGNVPLYFHPVEVNNGDWHMSRSGIVLEQKKGDAVTDHCKEDRAIISLATDRMAGSWVIVTKDGADYRHYEKYNAMRMRNFNINTVVEVQIRGNICLVLDETGTVVSSSKGILRENILWLDEVELP